jgi:hypothetical protein
MIAGITLLVMNWAASKLAGAPGAILPAVLLGLMGPSLDTRQQ